jgi:DNA primase
MSEHGFTYDIEVVRERTDLLALIGQYVTLKKMGGRYLGLCPFHQEKTPSFNVNPQKGFWHCFGCGKGGDAFKFLMFLEHLEFPEAIERLAEKAGIRPLVERESPVRKQERDFILEANEAAMAAFQTALKGKAGGEGRAYLEGRGITLEQATRFGLGYAPQAWDALATHLRTRGFAIEILEKANLVLKREHGGYFDRFRHRLMIPIYNRQGRVIAFGGRSLRAEDQPKYLNTAETPVFHKSRTLYALNWAGDAMARRGRAIVTEGYFDTIACHLAGFTEAIATLGTALGEEHVQLLRRLAERVYLVFDADSAGIKAALRSQALFRDAGVDVRVVRLPAGHDPDTLIREGGPEAFERCLAESLAPVAFELQQLVTRATVDTPEARIRLVRAAAEILQPLKPIDRAEYAEWLINRLPGKGGGIAADLQKALLAETAALDGRPPRRAAAPPPADASAAPPPPPPPPEAPLEREVMVALVQQPDFAARVLARIPEDAFTHPRYRAVFQALAALPARGVPPDVRHLILDEDTLATTLAALAVRDPLPLEGLTPDSMLERLLEEYESRQLVPREIALSDHEAAAELMTRLRERSRRRQRTIMGEEL